MNTETKILAAAALMSNYNWFFVESETESYYAVNVYADDDNYMDGKAIYFERSFTSDYIKEIACITAVRAVAVNKFSFETEEGSFVVTCYNNPDISNAMDGTTSDPLTLINKAKSNGNLYLFDFSKLSEDEYPYPWYDYNGSIGDFFTTFFHPETDPAMNVNMTLYVEMDVNDPSHLIFGAYDMEHNKPLTAEEWKDGITELFAAIFER